MTYDAIVDRIVRSVRRWVIHTAAMITIPPTSLLILFTNRRLPRVHGGKGRGYDPSPGGTRVTQRQEEIFFHIHSGLEREGPGSEESTLRALRALSLRNPVEQILDVGCGPGAQSLQLASLTEADIHAVDTYRPYLDRLAAAARDRGLAHRIRTVDADMGDLPFSAESFDLIWSEGAIYHVGLAKGLTLWRPLLKRDGCIAVSEISWLRNDAPEEVARYWKAAYPGMTGRVENETVFRDAGYDLTESFVLPERDWWDGYYNPLLGRLDAVEREFHDDAEALEVVALEREEIGMYRTYSDYYGYVFYIGKIRDARRIGTGIHT